MGRVSDSTLKGLITGFEMSMHNGIGAKGVENILSALTELRERRAAEKNKPEPYDAEWTNLECPKCHTHSVCLDKFGYRCVISGCGWTKDDPVKNG